MTKVPRTSARQRKSGLIKAHVPAAKMVEKKEKGDPMTGKDKPVKTSIVQTTKVRTAEGLKRANENLSKKS